jgi:hypothetical protein
MLDKKLQTQSINFRTRHDFPPVKANKNISHLEKEKKLDEKGSCPGSIHMERNHQGLQPKAYEFCRKMKTTSYQAECRSLELTPPV